MTEPVFATVAGQRIFEATGFIEKWGDIDGAHHKQWVIDQVQRILLGHLYDEWVATYEDNEQYLWDTGVAP